MGFLDRLRGKKPQSDAPSVPTSRAPLPPPAVPADHPVPEQAVQVTAMLYSGDETLEVVGESNYQRALRRIARVSDGSDIRHPIVAVLVPEPDNPYDENAIAVQIDGSVVGYLSRNDAVAYGPGLRALMADSGKYVALEGVAVGGGSNVIGVFLDHDPSDFGLIASGRPSTQRTAGAWDGEMRTGFSEAWLADADDDDYDLSWYNDLPEGDRAAIAQLRELLTSDPDPIDRHFQFAELEARLYRCRDLYDSALDEYDEACRLHDAEMEVICEAFLSKWGKVPLLDTYRQMTVRQQKKKDWQACLWWAERGLTLYGARAAREDAVEDLTKRRNRARTKLEPPARQSAAPTGGSTFPAPINENPSNLPPPEIAVVGEVEVLVCASCGTSFERIRVRGRKPTLCPDCRTAA
jgi:Zinc finger found in FPG and IleRS